MTTYTVEIIHPETQQNEAVKLPSFTRESQAERHAMAYAKAHPGKHVFLRFFRDSDHCQGYINRDGAACTGRAW